MAIRNVDTDLWNDGMIMDNFGMLEKYFWLFLLTTRYGNLSGCFKITPKQIQLDASLTPKQVDDLIAKFIELKMIDYDNGTGEILIINYLKYNYNRSPKFLKSVETQIEKIKNQFFKDFIFNVIENDGSFMGYQYGIDIVSIPFKDKDKDKDNIKDNVKIKDKDKKKYGEFENVLLTDDEFEKLKLYYLPHYEEYIKRLSLYLASKSVKYKSHYAVIKQWLNRENIQAEASEEAIFDEKGNLLNG